MKERNHILLVSREVVSTESCAHTSKLRPDCAVVVPGRIKFFPAVNKMKKQKTKKNRATVLLLLAFSVFWHETPVFYQLPSGVHVHPLCLLLLCHCNADLNGNTINSSVMTFDRGSRLSDRAPAPQLCTLPEQPESRCSARCLTEREVSFKTFHPP